MRSLAACAVAALLAGHAQAGSAQAATTRSVTGLSGQPVTVPASTRHIAELWHAHAELLVMLGAASSVSVVANRAATQPWMFRVAPALDHATQLSGNTVPSAEALLAAGIDLAFVPDSLAQASSLKRVGIPTVAVSFTDAASLLRCLDLTADVLNTGTARAIAARYRAFLNDTVRSVRVVTDPLPAQARPRVLHIVSLSPLRVDGSGTVIDDWIRIAGGRNAAVGLAGPIRPVSVEQVVAWNPDVIILGASAGSFDPAAAGALWRQVGAVRDGRVVRNPAGVFQWDRYGTEYALQLSWAAKTLHPYLFGSVDMIALTRRFYRDFFSYPLSPDEARRILAALPPA